MKLDAKDFKRLQWAIVFLLIMAALGAASVLSALQLKASSEKSFKEATAARSEVQTRLARAREEQAELHDKITRFQALRERGYIGAEQRLDWIEAIARIKAARRLFKLDYEFAPQRPADASVLPGGASAGGFEIMASQMRLQAHLLHEGELLLLLDDLRNAVQALIQIRSCSMERIASRPSDRTTGAQVKAECTLEWITLREAK